MGWLGNFDEGEVLLERGLHFASEINDKSSMGLVEWFYGMFYLVKGDGKCAIEHSQNSTRYTEEAKYFIILGQTWNALGWGYYLTGEFEAAKSCAEKGLNIQGDAGLTFWLSFHFLIMGMIQFDSGDLESARVAIEKALRLSQNSSEKHAEGISKIWLGRIFGKSDKGAEARGKEYIVQGIKILDELKIKPYQAQGYLFLGELYANIRQRKKALENLNRADGMLKEMGMDYWLGKTSEVLDRL